MQLELYTRYTFNFTNDVQFGDIPLDILYDIFKDGRITSELLSHTFVRRFDGLTYVDKQGYDFLHDVFGMIEQKQVTKSGLKFAPSRMIGVGRKVTYDDVVDHIVDNDLQFLLADITSFPIVTSMLIPGLTLLDNCSNKTCSFTYNNAVRIFNYATKPKEESTDSGHCLHAGTTGD